MAEEGENGQNGQIQHIYWENPPSPETENATSTLVDQLRHGRLQSLSTTQLKRVRFTEHLANSIAECKSLKKMSVPKGVLRIEDMPLVGRILQTNSSLTHLSFYESEIGDDRLIALAPYLMHTPNLISLNLNRNRLTHTAIAVLCYAIKDNRNIRELRLSLNNFQDEGLKHVCKLLKRNQVIETLEITSCGIKSASAIALAKLIVERNVGLKCLKMLARQRSQTEMDLASKLFKYFQENKPGFVYIWEGEGRQDSGLPNSLLSAPPSTHHPMLPPPSNIKIFIQAANDNYQDFEISDEDSIEEKPLKRKNQNRAKRTKKSSKKAFDEDDDDSEEPSPPPKKQKKEKQNNNNLNETEVIESLDLSAPFAFGQTTAPQPSHPLAPLPPPATPNSLTIPSAIIIKTEDPDPSVTTTTTSTSTIATTATGTETTTTTENQQLQSPQQTTSQQEVPTQPQEKS